MPIDIDKIIGKIRSGEYSHNEIEALLKNAKNKDGTDAEKIAFACSEVLDTSKPKSRDKPTRNSLGIVDVWWLAIDLNNGKKSYSSRLA